MDLYQSKESKLRGIKNYGIDVKLFKWDYRNCVITKIHIDETKRLGDLIYGSDSDNVIHDDGDDDDDEVESSNVSNKVEIKKYEIFTQKQKVKTDSVVQLRSTSFLILLFHIAMAIIYFVFSNLFIQNSQEYINAISYLSKQLNYTTSSADLLMTLIIKNRKEYEVTDNSLQENTVINKKLESNAMVLYEIDSSINELKLFYNQNLSNIFDNNVSFTYIEDQGSVPVFSSLDFYFLESNLEVV